MCISLIKVNSLPQNAPSFVLNCKAKLSCVNWIMWSITTHAEFVEMIKGIDLYEWHYLQHNVEWKYFIPSWEKNQRTLENQQLALTCGICQYAKVALIPTSNGWIESQFTNGAGIQWNYARIIKGWAVAHLNIWRHACNTCHIHFLSEHWANQEILYT